MSEVLPAAELVQRLGNRLFADVVEVVQGVGTPDHRLRDIPDGHPAGGLTLFPPRVGMSVDDEIGARAVDCLGKEVAPEERVKLESLAVERFWDWRVVEQRDSEVTAKSVQRGFKGGRALLRMAHERLHLGFAEFARAGAEESAAESFDTGYPNACALYVDGRSVALEQANVTAREFRGNLVITAGVVIVIAKDGENGRPDPQELVQEHRRLFGCAEAGEVPRDQQEIGLIAEMCDVRPQRSDGIRPEVNVGHCRDADHERCSARVGSWNSRAIRSLWISQPGNRSLMTS